MQEIDLRFEMSARIPSSWTSTSKMQVLKDTASMRPEFV